MLEVKEFQIGRVFFNKSLLAKFNFLSVTIRIYTGRMSLIIKNFCFPII